ncbi:DUF1036 domain-containing protein [Jannaschia sp. LMIT008]|uniref:DUF1036 domain-containing protein n=1 Tax=Jannaschia maritima TaxID=3032585 RepID=UPI002810E736|nr:DUF1036 domain-containing protein [Jannaschia sp. LMIT008]
MTAFAAMPAMASFTVCNSSFDVANVAVAQPRDGGFRTEGWWRIGPAQCAEVIPDALAARYLYVHAMDVFGRTLLSGAVRMCVDTERFVIDGQDDCLLRGYVPADFVEVDTGQRTTWRLFLTPRPR